MKLGVLSTLFKGKNRRKFAPVSLTTGDFTKSAADAAGPLDYSHFLDSSKAFIKKLTDAHTQKTIKEKNPHTAVKRTFVALARVGWNQDHDLEKYSALIKTLENPAIKSALAKALLEKHSTGPYVFTPALAIGYMFEPVHSMKALDVLGHQNEHKVEHKAAALKTLCKNEIFIQLAKADPEAFLTQIIQTIHETSYNDLCVNLTEQAEDFVENHFPENTQKNALTQLKEALDSSTAKNNALMRDSDADQPAPGAGIN